MQDYSNYRKPPSDTLLWSGKRLFERKLEDFGKDVKIDGVETKAIIMFHSNPYNEDKEDRKFLCEDAVEINRNSIIDYDNSKWLVISEIKSNGINKYTRILQCNNVIKFYDKNNILYEIPCFVGSVSLDTDTDTYIEIPTSTVQVRVSNNEITRQIRRGDIYKIGLQSYVVKDINDIDEPGLLVLKLEYSQQPQEEHDYKLTILNGDNLQIAQSQSLILNVQLTDSDEIIDTPPLLYSSSDESIAIVSDSGEVTILNSGVVTFTVSLKTDESINDSITVEIIADEQDNFTYELLGRSEITLGYSQNYIANKYNNGILVSNARFDFSIVTDDIPDDAYILSVVSDNECKITANKSAYIITLRAEDVDTGEIIEKNIKLKNLF